MGLTGQTIAAVDAQGRRPQRRAGQPAGQASELLRAAFASDVGLDEAALSTKDGGFVWFDVTKIDPAHELTFEEAKPEVEKQWRAEEVDKALAGKADDLVKQIEAGGSVAEVSEERGRRSQKRRQTSIAPSETSLPESVVAAIFREPADGAGSAATPDGRVVFKITADRRRRSISPTPASRRWRPSSTPRPATSLLDQYVAALRRTLGVVVHQDVLQSAEGG